MARTWAFLTVMSLTLFVHAQPPSLESLAGSKIDVKAPIKLVQDRPVPAILPADECVPPPAPKFWSGGLDFGLNATDGNSDAFNMRLFAETKRERPSDIFTASALYNYATAQANVTQNMLLANTRYEWLLGPSPWSYWVSGGLQYDQFRAFDLLLFAHTGLGYQCWKNEVSQLKTRFGFGGSQPVGGPDEEFQPEMLLGLDYEHKFHDRAKFVFSGTAYPDMAQWGEWRATVQTYLEFIVSPEYNLGFKIGAVDMYISDPQGKAPNDLNYFAALAWKY